MGGMAELGRSIGNPELVDVLNVSTGTIEKFMLLARANSITASALADADGSTGDYPQPVIQNNSVSFTGFSPFGYAHAVIPPLKRGPCLRSGATFVRVGSNTLNAGSRGVPTTTNGLTIAGTGDLAVFFATITASQTIVLNGVTIGFTVSHAYGFADFSRCGP